jgi:hypothetical protein
LYPFLCVTRYPQFHLPLLPQDNEPVLRLQEILDAICEEAALQGKAGSVQRWRAG